MTPRIDSWRDRLKVAVEKSGKSQRAISLGAGMGAGYINSLLNEGKTPTIDNAIAICSQLNISLSYLLYGFEMGPETEQILVLLERNPSARSGILQILRAQVPSGGSD